MHQSIWCISERFIALASHSLCATFQKLRDKCAWRPSVFDRLVQGELLCALSHPSTVLLCEHASSFCVRSLKPLALLCTRNIVDTLSRCAQ
eukprot:IDg15712t1